MAGEVYAGILIDRVRRMTRGLIGDEQWDFREGRGCVYQIFTLKQIGDKKCRVYVGFMDLEKAYDRVNMEALWQVLRIYDVGGKLLNAIKECFLTV